MMRKVIIMFFLTLFSFTTIATANDNTSSAPGLGNNLTDVIPVSQTSTYKKINNQSI